MNVNKVLTKDYENKTLGERGKKQSQTNPNKAKFKKAKMNVNKVLTKDYENKSHFWVKAKQTQYKPNTNPNKPNLTSAGWDFVTIPAWKMNCEGMSYPKLSWWQPMLGDFGCPDGVDMRDCVVLAEQARRPKKPFTIDLKNLSQLTYKTFRLFAKSPQIGSLKAVLRLFGWIKTAFAV